MAGVIREVIDKDPRARFDVEGHASTDGAALFNMDLSVERARRIFDELTLRYRLPAAVLTAQGFGENYPMYPNGTEDQRMLDRRVLIVRTQ
jgi:OOP family OmpA-OmpF porin